MIEVNGVFLKISYKLAWITMRREFKKHVKEKALKEKKKTTENKKKQK